MERQNSENPIQQFASLVDFDSVDCSFDQEKLEYLVSLLTPNRRERFGHVMAGRTRKITVLLENLSQSHNFSAILRSCDCFGVQDVHVVDPREVFEVSKDVALGAEKWLSIQRYHGKTAAEQSVRHLKDAGYRVVVTSPHGESESIRNVDVSTPLAVVFGTELAGISDEMESLADGRVHLPMFGFTESFNVSVAAALCLSELTHRLRDSAANWALGNDERAELLLQWARRSIKKIDEIESRFDDERAATSRQKPQLDATDR